MTSVFNVQYEIRSTKFGSICEATIRYVPRRSTVNHDKVQKLGRDLDTWLESLPENLNFNHKQTGGDIEVNHKDHSMDVHRGVLWGIYLTLVGNLHRPQALPTSLGRTIATDFRENSRQRVREMAVSATTMLRSLAQQKLLNYLPNTGVAVILFATVYHLLIVTSQDVETSKRRVENPRFCIQALQQMQDIHLSVEGVYRILQAFLPRIGLYSAH